MTDANARGVRAGDEPLPLTGRGCRQAVALGAAVRRTAIDAVWTSPLVRARQTAELVARTCGLSLHCDDGLREIDPGPWGGLTEAEIAERYPEAYGVWQSDPSALHLPGRESLGVARARIGETLDRILAEGGRPLCVTHLGAMRVARIYLTGAELSEFGATSPAHCKLVEFESRDGGWRLRTQDAARDRRNSDGRRDPLGALEGVPATELGPSAGTCTGTWRRLETSTGKVNAATALGVELEVPGCQPASACAST